jgi:tetratricopeptide (TPR) repeat protein
MNDVQRLQQLVSDTFDPVERAEILVRLGYMISQNGDHHEALKIFEQAIATHSQSATSNEAFQRAAVEAHHIGDYEKAITYFQTEMPQEIPLESRINFLIIYGDSYARLNQFEDALEIYSQAITLVLDMPKGEDRIQTAKTIKVRADYAIKNLRKNK